jgi:ParB-like chromosome segregation protein Spo0J
VTYATVSSRDPAVNPAVASINSIVIGDRHRRDLGDIDALAASIADVGLMHPIVITPDGRLIAGQRRLEACRQLGWVTIQVTVIELDELLKGELAENSMRKDFAPSEAVAIGLALEERERELARARQSAAGGDHSALDNLPEADKGRVRDRVGAMVGMSGSTYEAAKTVIRAAEDDPEAFGSIAEEMDRTGKVHGPYRKALAVKAETKDAEPVKRTAEFIEARRARIREMGRAGFRIEEIAAKEFVGENVVSEVLAKAGIQTANQKLGRAQRAKANEVMDNIVLNAKPPDEALALVSASWDELDATRFPEWSHQLHTAIRSLTTLRNRIKGMN